MTAKILDGKAIAAMEQEKIANEIACRIQLGRTRPGLAVILIGSDPPSQIYVQRKREACAKVGIHSECHEFPADVKEETILEKIDELNHSAYIHGILVQLPIPKHISTPKVLEAIAPHKDVDGFHAYNLGRLVQHQSGLHPCTPSGVMLLLEHTDLEIKGCEACVVGASNIVGRPMAIELLNRSATVTICHIKTKNIHEHIQRADLLVVAIGNPRYIQGDWIKQNAVVIDVGINRLADGRVVGDVDFEQAIHKASWITPVPGGVGPMTVTALLRNTLIAAG